jgi:GWxTD domain-containing protein
MNEIIMKRLLALFFLLCSLPVWAQPEFELNYINDYKKTFTTQPIFYPTPKGDSLEIFVPFRFSLNFLTFEKSAVEGKLFAVSLVDLVLRDSTGVIRKSINRLDTFFFPESQRDSINVRSFVSFFKFRLPIQNYNIEISLFDKGKIKVKTLQNVIKISIWGNLIVCSPIFCSSSDQNEYILSLQSNNLDFRKKNKKIIIPIFSKTHFAKLVCEIKSVNDKTYNIQWNKPVKFDVMPQMISTQPFSYKLEQENIKIYFEQRTYAAGEPYLSFLIIDFPEKYSFLQSYDLNLSAPDYLKDSLTFRFGISWENIPISLRNIRYAVDLFYYIITDEEYKGLLDKRKEEIWTAFFDLWRKFDPDTSTMFNEAMDEFYRRADYCYFNFQTVYERDGARSDRGKIFILYGKPSVVNRDMYKDGVITEVWFYYRLKKKFIFVTKDKKFQLVDIVNL